MDETRVIKIWSFEDAPEEYKRYDNAGDEDWIAFIPKHFIRCFGIPVFLEQNNRFGCCCVNEYETEEGTILIACHA